MSVNFSCSVECTLNEMHYQIVSKMFELIGALMAIVAIVAVIVFSFAFLLAVSSS